MDEYDGFRDYFESRRRWIYGLLVLMFAIDLVDTAIKGADHFAALGPEYLVRQGLMIVGAIIAFFVSSKRYQIFFVAIAIVWQVIWIIRLFDVLQ
jgi:hypothetical protein